MISAIGTLSSFSSLAARLKMSHCSGLICQLNVSPSKILSPANDLVKMSFPLKQKTREESLTRRAKNKRLSPAMEDHPCRGANSRQREGRRFRGLNGGEIEVINSQAMIIPDMVDIVPAQP